MLFLVRRIFFVAAYLAASALSAITIELDYSYDTNDFFDQPGAKEALRAVADFYEERIHDNLLEIDQVAFGETFSMAGGQASWNHRQECLCHDPREKVFDGHATVNPASE